MSDFTGNINLKPEMIIDIIVKRRLIIVVPFCLSLLVGIYLAITLPRIYEAETLILVEPQRVPANYVQSIVSTDISARISTISQQIMSRTNLEKIINEFKLYADEKWQGVYLEDKLEDLRKRITVNLTRRSGSEAFRIAFKDSSPEKVMTVANALASYFIDENLKVREAQAIGTSTFLDEELNNMRNRLEEREEKLKEYKKRYMGGLPEQLESNLSILESLQTQKNDKQVIIREVEQNIYTLKNTADSFNNFNGEFPMDSSFDDDFEDQESYELTKLQESLEQLKLRYKDKHPDVVRLKKRIEELEEKIKNSATESTQEEETPVEIPMPEINFQEVQLAELKSSLDEHKRELNEINKQIEIYKNRVEDTPRREQELLSIERDYNNLRGSYQSLLDRKLESEIAVNMERRQKGEQFRVLDPARLPEKPVSPSVKKLFLLFFGAGLAIGGGIVLLLEYMDQTFKTPQEIEKELKLTVLCNIPQLFESSQERLKKIEKRSFVAVFALSMVSLVIFAILTLKGVNESLEIVKKFVT